MNQLVPTSASLPAPVLRHVRIEGRTACLREPLRSPVSGVECVYWRLRIVEELEPTLRLVHEMASSEAFEIVASTPHGDAAAARVRIAPASADIRGTAVLHRPGTPGALAAGRHFELLGSLGVEEIVVRPGDAIVAEGVLESLGGNAAPFRDTRDTGGTQDTMGGHELLEAVVRMPSRSALGPVLLPWALGTAAALLGGIGAATWAAAHYDLFPRLRHATALPMPAVFKPVRFERRHFARP